MQVMLQQVAAEPIDVAKQFAAEGKAKAAAAAAAAAEMKRKGKGKGKATPKANAKGKAIANAASTPAVGAPAAGSLAAPAFGAPITGGSGPSVRYGCSTCRYRGVVRCKNTKGKPKKNCMKW